MNKIGMTTKLKILHLPKFEGFFIAFISALSFVNAPAFCQTNSNAPELPDIRSENQVNPTDPGKKIVEETPVGTIYLGMIHSTITEQNKYGKADLELGQIYKFKGNGLIPSIIEVQPFLVNRVAQDGDSINATSGYGGGLRVSAPLFGSPTKWFMSLAVLNSTVVGNGVPIPKSETGIEFFAGFEVPLSHEFETSRLGRVRNASRPPIVLSIPKTLYERRETMPEGERRLMHSLLMATYFGHIKAAFKADPKMHYADSDPGKTMADELIHFLSVDGVFISRAVEDALRGQAPLVEANDPLQTALMSIDRKKEALNEIFKPWLVKNLRDRFPLEIQIRESEYRAVKIYPQGFLAQPQFLDPYQMIDDFISMLADSLDVSLRTLPIFENTPED